MGHVFSFCGGRVPSLEQSVSTTNRALPPKQQSAGRRWFICGCIGTSLQWGWKPGSPMPTPRRASMTAILGRRLYGAGGLDGRKDLSVFEVYDSAQRAWGASPRNSPCRQQQYVPLRGARAGQPSTKNCISSAGGVFHLRSRPLVQGWRWE